MIDRKLTGAPMRHPLPRGSVDTQMHAYLPGFPALLGGPGMPPAPLPTPDMYRQVMGWLGIDRVVVTQANAHQKDNACLLACLKEFGDVARGVAVITPETSDTEMAELSAAGIVGARIMDLPGGGVGLAHLEAIDAKAADANWMMAVQFDGSALPELENRLSKVKSRWVIDHHAKIFSGATPHHIDALKRLIDGGNVWFKFAGCYESSQSGGPDFEDIAEVALAIAAHAPERIIWGTNWPHNGAIRTEDYPNDAALADTALDWLGGDANRLKALMTNPGELFNWRHP